MLFIGIGCKKRSCFLFYFTLSLALSGSHSPAIQFISFDWIFFSLRVHLTLWLLLLLLSVQRCTVFIYLFYTHKHGEAERKRWKPMTTSLMMKFEYFLCRMVRRSSKRNWKKRQNEMRKREWAYEEQQHCPLFRKLALAPRNNIVHEYEYTYRVHV